MAAITITCQFGDGEALEVKTEGDLDNLDQLLVAAMSALRQAYAETHEVGS